MEGRGMLEGGESGSSESRGTLLRAGGDRQSARANRRRFVQGIVLLVLVNIIWVGASVLVKYIYNDLGFNQPFFVTYVSNSLFMMYLAGVPLLAALKRWLCPAPPQSAGKYMAQTDQDGDSDGDVLPPPRRPFTLKETAKVSLYICPVWFLAQCTYNASLDWTSVASSTILSTVSGLFTFVISVVVLKEAFRHWKLAGVAATILGAVFVGLADRDDPDSNSDTIGGDALALFSAFCYAVYTTMIRKFIPDEHTVSMALFFGFLGLFNCIALLPVVIILHATGTESLDGLDFKLFCFICLKGFVDNVLSDWLWARAVLLTSPTIATIGLTLTIPLSMLSDWIVKGNAPSALLVLGALCVSLGFVAVNLGGQYHGPERAGSGSAKRPDSVGGISVPGRATSDHAASASV